MGLFDTYGDVQIKVGDVGMVDYAIGDHVPIPDGVYVGLEGVIVIHHHQLIAEYDGVNTKSGTKIDPEDILHPARSLREP